MKIMWAGITCHEEVLQRVGEKKNYGNVLFIDMSTCLLCLLVYTSTLRCRHNLRHIGLLTSLMEENIDKKIVYRKSLEYIDQIVRGTQIGVCGQTYP